MNNPFNSIIALFEDLFENADKKLVDIISTEHSRDIILTAPAIIITLYKQALILNHAFFPENTTSQTPHHLNRISVHPSDDWAVTLFHKDYSLNKDWRMKRKLRIPATLNHSSKNKMTLSVSDFCPSE
jgi:hypothetical protein